VEISRRVFLKRAALLGAAVAYLGPVIAFAPMSPEGIRGNTIKGITRDTRRGITRNVVLIGWDSADRDRVWECLDRGELPNTAGLIEEGGIIAIDHIDGESLTVTKTGWTQVLTGYGCDTTGVYGNAKFRQLPEDWTIYERLKNHFGSDNFVTAAAVGKQHIGPTTIFHKCSMSMEEFIYPPQKWKDDDIVTNYILHFLEKYHDKPFLFFVMLGDLDIMGHVYGENSTEYHNALIHCDALTGDIVAKLKALGLYDGTLIYITSDHGHDGTPRERTSEFYRAAEYKGMPFKYFHHGCPNVFLATNDPLITRNGAYPSKTPAGTLLDIAPTILTRFGLDLDKIDPPLYGSPLLDQITVEA
jgi:hypothetical protein